MTAHTEFRLPQVCCHLEIVKHNEKPSLQPGDALNSGINYIHFPLIYISGVRIVETQTCVKTVEGESWHLVSLSHARSFSLCRSVL